MPSDLGQEELKPIADSRALAGLVDDFLGLHAGLLLGPRLAHLEPDPLELARELLDVRVGELVLDRERLQLGRLDQAALLPRLEHRLRAFALEQADQLNLRHVCLHPLATRS